MTALLKAVPLSFALTIICSFFLYPYGAYSNYFYVQHAVVGYFEFYWSWPIFIVSTVFGWFLFWMLEWS